MKSGFALAALLVLALAAPTAAEEQRVTVNVGDRPFRGVADAPVTMVEFLDFQ